MRNRLLNIVLVSLAAFTFAWGESPLIEKGWQPAEKQWDRSLGTHRVIVKVDAPVAAVKADLEWRRPDREPEKKAVIVVDLKTGQPIANVITLAITNVSGQILFQPTSGAGEYAVYFLPVKIDGGNFPASKYKEPQDKADAAWKATALTTNGKAEPVRWEAISAHDAWNDMEVIATAEEEAALAKKLGENPLYARIESREHPVRMFGRLPLRWITEAESPILTAQPGEFLAFQVALWVPAQSPAQLVSGVFLKSFATAPKVKNSQLQGVAPQADPNPSWPEISFLMRGTNGKTITVNPGEVKSIWCGFTIPPESTPGDYQADLLFFDGREGIPGPFQLKIKVAGEPWKESLSVDARKLNRLQWLDSKEAVDYEPVKGYEPIQLDAAKRELHFLGRTITLSPSGLPMQITSHFNKAVTKVAAENKLNLLTGPFVFSTGLTPVGPVPETLQFNVRTPGLVKWRVLSNEANVTTLTTGSLSSDGNLQYRIAVTASEDVVLPEVKLTIPRTPETCEYVIGMGQEAGFTKPAWDWKWDVANKNQDSVWLGAVNGGMRIQLLDDQYHRPPVNIHYRRNPLVLPSWGNEGKGTVKFANNTLTAILGERKLGKRQPQEPSDGLVCSFNLLITPFHPLRTEKQWSERYYHTSQVPADTAKYLDSAKAAGANLINIHQGNSLIPYINYPFLTADRLKEFTDLAHQRDMRVKYYYTVRELSNWAPELFAIRSMGDSILPHGKGGGHPWLEEHLGGDYWGAWYEPGVQDASVLTKPTGKWLNYYVEGLKWLVEHTGCDGLYLDDISYDRETMERCRKVLDRYNPRGGRIDLHSWNEFHGGGAWAQCANIFMDSLPFVDRIWFGEGHHYTGPPAEHFLVELSGIPFGLMGEMLEGGGNPWFGLVHGMTGRLGWQGNPRPVWKVWDDFGLEGSEFIGWWAGKDSPVQTGDGEVKATLWKKPGATLLALANFAKTNRKATLQIDWKALGLDPKKVKFYQPPVLDLKQREALLPMDQPLLVKAYSGVVLVLDETERALQPSAGIQVSGEVLLLEDFSKGLGAEWKPMISDKVKSPSTVDGGYVLNAPANVHAFLERKLPETAGGVSARIWQDGKDEGQQWGPGLALVWPNGNTLKVSIRQDQRITVSVNGSDDMPGSMTSRAVVELRVHWDKDNISIIAGGPAMGDLDEELMVLPRSKISGQPSLLRVGKMPNNAAAQDFGTPGPIGFNRFENVKIYGARK